MVFTLVSLARLGITGERAVRMEGLPICSPNNDADWIAECKRLNQKGDTRAAAGAYCRVQNPARQKQLGKELWGME